MMLSQHYNYPLHKYFCIKQGLKPDSIEKSNSFFSVLVIQPTFAFFKAFYICINKIRKHHEKLHLYLSFITMHFGLPKR